MNSTKELKQALILDPQARRKVERVHTILNVLEFNSARKWDARMSVIARNEKSATTTAR